MAELFLGNIPHTFTKEQVAEWVESFGFPVLSVDLIIDRTTRPPRTFGFVLLQDDEALPDAITELSGQSMGGRPITAGKAHPLTRSVTAGPPVS